jgi:CubicO group peptidase (beta-lactamase class C family)
MGARSVCESTLLLLLAAGLASCGSTGLDRVQPDSGSALGAFLEEYLNRRIGSASVGYTYAVFRRGEPVAVGASGYSVAPADDSAGAGVTMTPDTPLQIASSSKPITAVALLHLLEERGISPDTTFLSLLAPAFPGLVAGDPRLARITIAQLLAHRSGFAYGYIESPRIENTRTVLEARLDSDPGSTYQYSNINTSLARTLLETISGEDYGYYVRRVLLLPAEASSMSLAAPDRRAGNAYFFGSQEGVPLDRDWTDDAGPYGWYASAPDLARFLWAAQSARYLSDSLTERMFRDNLGWRPQATPAGSGHVHEGQWVFDEERGIHSGVAILPDSVVAVLLLNTNSGFSASGVLTDAFARAIPRMLGYARSGSDTAVVRVETPMHSEFVTCTTDGSEPQLDSPRYTGAVLLVPVPATVRCRGFANGTAATFVNTTVVTGDG